MAAPTAAARAETTTSGPVGLAETYSHWTRAPWPTSTEP